MRKFVYVTFNFREGVAMVRKICRKVDYAVDAWTFFVLVGGGAIFHLVTSFAVKGTYGNPWGYLAFFFPGGAEIAYAVADLTGGNYQYPLLLCLCLCIASLKGLLWYGKNLLKRRLTRSFELSAEQC